MQVLIRGFLLCCNKALLKYTSIRTTTRAEQLQSLHQTINLKSNLNLCSTVVFCIQVFIKQSQKIVPHLVLELVARGVMNGPLKFLTGRKILPLLDLLAKFKRVLACKCSPNFCSCSQARKAKFLFLLVLAKKSQCSACSRMLAKTIRHPQQAEDQFMKSNLIQENSRLFNDALHPGRGGGGGIRGFL